MSLGFNPSAPISIRGLREMAVRVVNDDGTFGDHCRIHGAVNMGINPRFARKRIGGRCCTKRINSKIKGGTGSIQHACWSFDTLAKITGSEIIETADEIEFCVDCSTNMPIIEITGRVCQVFQGGRWTGGDHRLIVSRAVLTSWRIAHQDLTWFQGDLQFEFFPDDDGKLFRMIRRLEEEPIF